jgi:hypothetical protein
MKQKVWRFLNDPVSRSEEFMAREGGSGRRNVDCPKLLEITTGIEKVLHSATPEQGEELETKSA